MSPARPPPPRRHPGAGLGAATGSVSRVAVLDLDAPTVDLPLRLPAGPLVRSLRQGGLHHYFEIGAAVPTVRTLFGIPGVELLGEGALAAAPPTAIDGRGYRWLLRPEAGLPPLPAES